MLCSVPESYVPNMAGASIFILAGPIEAATNFVFGRFNGGQE